MLNFKQNQLFIEKSAVKVLASKFGTPLFVYSKNKIASNFNNFRDAFNGVNNLICYAVKANSNHSILKLLAKLGAGVDITSGGELFRSLEAGFKPQNIVYAGIGKSAEEIEYALKSNILMFNVESIEEIDTINLTARRLKKKARIAFRINPHIDPHTHHYISTGKSGVKFGIPYKDAVDAYLYARSLSNIEIVGIHSHIGSQITLVKPFVLAAQRVAKLLDRLSRNGIELKYIDLGGGLGIEYLHETPPEPSALRKALVPVFPGFKGTFVFEPGRYIVGNAGVLVTKVIYRKSVEGKNFLIVNAGMNDLVRPTLYEAYHDIVAVEKTGGKMNSFDVVGPICETGDFLGKNRRLPWVEQGGLLAVKCAGAYGFAMSSQYNSRLRAAEVMIDGSKAALIRGRESYRDLVFKEKK